MSNFNGRKPDNFIGHFERYVFATLFVRRKRVLDLGCKDGYGAHLLSSFAHSVTLADRAPSYLEAAKESYRYLCPVDYACVDFEEGFPEGEWDVIVGFEVIEHVANYEGFVKNIAAHLAPGGILVFSVPHMIVNDDHKVLFDEKKIRTLISKYFTLEEFYLQDKIGISGKKATSPPLSYVGVARKL